MFDANPPQAQINPDEQGQSPQSVLPLSPTEKLVCALLLERLTEQRIAEQIGRSPNTVHVHVRNIYRKLGVRTRKQLLEFPGIANMVVQQD